MKIVVLVKQVPDTSAKVNIRSDGSDVDQESISLVTNPYDEYAIEEAARIKKANVGSTITIISIGGEKAADVIRNGIALGGDEGIHIKNQAKLDAIATAQVLAKVVGEIKPDLILCGKVAVDDGWGAVPPMLAEYLDIPHITAVKKLDLNGNAITAEKDFSTGSAKVESPLPCVVTCEKGLNEPRYASLMEMMKAKKKELKVIDVGSLGIAEVGTSIIETLKLNYPPERPAGKVLQGDLSAQVKELAGKLK